MDSEFAAAIAGAVVGGVIAFGVQMAALRAAADARKSEATERRQALGRSLLIKVLQIHSHLASFRAHMLEGFREVEDRGGEPWQFVRAMANHPSEVRFTSDELATLLSAKNDELFNKVFSLDEIHNATLAAFETYRSRRFYLTDQLSTVDPEAEGPDNKTDITAEEMKLLRPRMNEVSDLAAKMLEMTVRDTAEAEEAMLDLAKLFREKLGLTHRIELKVAAADEAEVIPTL